MLFTINWGLFERTVLFFEVKTESSISDKRLEEFWLNIKLILCAIISMISLFFHLPEMNICNISLKSLIYVEQKIFNWSFQSILLFKVYVCISCKRKYRNYLSILKKVTAAAAADVTENEPRKNEKTNSFRNTKFGTQIAFSMKMCKMPSSKIKDQWGLRWGPP